jgi:hypothetical protein
MTKGAMGQATASDARDYAAMATPVTSAQVMNAWLRAERNLAAVFWLEWRATSWRSHHGWKETAAPATAT